MGRCLTTAVVSFLLWSLSSNGCICNSTMKSCYKNVWSQSTQFCCLFLHYMKLAETAVPNCSLCVSLCPHLCDLEKFVYGKLFSRTLRTHFDLYPFLSSLSLYVGNQSILAYCMYVARTFWSNYCTAATF